VIIPAFREEENLRLLLPRLRHSLEGLGRTFEILVIDTVEPLDLTAAVCAEQGVGYQARWPGNSYGDAVRTGVGSARGDWIAFMDADGSHAPEMLVQLLARTTEYDVVIGSRYVEGGHTENPFILRLMSRIVNGCYSVVLGLPVRDVSNSLKVYRGCLLRGLKLRCSNFDIIEEILVKLVRKHPGMKMVEVPVNFRKRIFGETKRNLVLFMLSYVVTLAKLRFMPLE